MRSYTDEDIINHAANVTTLAQLLRSLGLIPAGGNYINMKRNLQRLTVDTSHWTGQGWNKDQQLKDWSEYTSVDSLKKILVKERGHRCERCRRTMWLGEPIPLQAHHVDGDRTHNVRTNLLLLCLNCHGLTGNWRGRNKKK
jgi:hypothetical protein